jgi:NAD(P)H-dependent flavin oxidoreductase YrpB (nitropropane dioxygenase family)
MTIALAEVVYPSIIQGGMGVGVSSWLLAKAVSSCGQLGVVSGTALDTVFVRRLQDGDIGGHLRRAIACFPIPGVGADALSRYYLEGGRAADQPYRMLPMYRKSVSVARQQLTMLASFAEVHLAKEGHEGVVGINLLTKVQLPNLASLCGAMLAGVDYVLMGAGIPREIPGVLDAFSEHRVASLRFDVDGPPSAEPEFLALDPVAHGVTADIAMRRPRFIAIVAASSLATTLARKANGRVDGFVIEGPTAGGHNAPPRGEQQLNERGEPIYGDRDIVDLGKIAELGVPYWLAGGAGSHEGLAHAIAVGATGVQVGTLFAYCDESGVTEELKQSVLHHAARGEVDVITDPRASPTGFPFKIVRWAGEPSDAPARTRKCDLGYLRTAYRDASGRVGFRCPAEPVDAYVKKGGAIADTVGRQCLCNGLTSNIGQAQLRENGFTEPPLLTSGDDLLTLPSFLGSRTSYTASDVVSYLLGG